MNNHGAHARRRASRYRRVSNSPFAVLLRRLSARHGWRLYAIPVLLVITVAALVPGHRSTSPARADAVATTQANAAARSSAIGTTEPASTASGSVPSSSSAGAAVAPTTATPTGTPAATPTATPTATATATASKATASKEATKATPSPSADANKAYGQLISVPPARSSAVCAENTDRQHVFVSLAEQHAWMCERSQLVRESVVTTGATSHDRATPRGTWKVQAKQTDRRLNGRDYSVHVDYWVPFNGDYGFHDAAWQQMPFGTTGYKTLGSHGCVHLPMAQMKWFYHWARVGASVTITK